MENQIFELQYAMDTFYFLICGALVMWMAAGFSMLEAGLVRTKNTTEILTKNVGLFAIACTMYLVCGYQFMYDGGYFLSGVTTVAQMDDAAVAQVLSDSAEEGSDTGELKGMLHLRRQPQRSGPWQRRKSAPSPRNSLCSAAKSTLCWARPSHQVPRTL